MAQDFPVFLTDYDPSDLPGGSIDPLGFDRGYGFLADKLLPGMTNVANQPRYLSVLCTGAAIAEIDSSAAPRKQYQLRSECLQRFERLWALANVLASQHSGKALPTGGIRGVTYAQARADALSRRGSSKTDADFRLLSRQSAYGVLGIYGAVAGELGFWDRKTLSLTAAFGEPLAQGFKAKTNVPSAVIEAAKGLGDVSVEVLTNWGVRSHVAGASLDCERKYLRDAMHRDPDRARMLQVLAANPAKSASEAELARLNRILAGLPARPESSRSRSTVAAILEFENCYQLSVLAFERLLWVCRRAPASAATFKSDSVIATVCAGLPAAFAKLQRVLNDPTADYLKMDADRIQDVRDFLERASLSCAKPESLIEHVLGRHGDVQRGKFDRGRRKMPWLEMVNGKIGVSLTEVGGLRREVSRPQEIVPHPYRLAAADAFNMAIGDARR